MAFFKQSPRECSPSSPACSSVLELLSKNVSQMPVTISFVVLNQQFLSDFRKDNTFCVHASTTDRQDASAGIKGKMTGADFGKQQDLVQSPVIYVWKNTPYSSFVFSSFLYTPDFKPGRFNLAQAGSCWENLSCFFNDRWLFPTSFPLPVSAAFTWPYPEQGSNRSSSDRSPLLSAQGEALGGRYLGQDKSFTVCFEFLLDWRRKVTAALMGVFSWQTIQISSENMFVQYSECLILSFPHIILCTSGTFLFLQALKIITCFLPAKEIKLVCIISIWDTLLGYPFRGKPTHPILAFTSLSLYSY